MIHRRKDELDEGIMNAFVYSICFVCILCASFHVLDIFSFFYSVFENKDCYHSYRFELVLKQEDLKRFLLRNLTFLSDKIFHFIAHNV